MFSGHYDQWRNNRIDVTNALLTTDFFREKSVLEVGCGYGDIGNAFSQQGATVTCSDARREHIEVLTARHPHLKTRVDDMDRWLDDMPHFDVIIHFGLLYHLKNPSGHLIDVSQYCDYLFFETEVCDSTNPDDILYTNENGYDQAFNAVGSRPSPSYIEKILSLCNFSFRMITTPSLNHDFHRYDWEHRNDKHWEHGLRRFWICWKNSVPTPLC